MKPSYFFCSSCIGCVRNLQLCWMMIISLSREFWLVEAFWFLSIMWVHVHAGQGLQRCEVSCWQKGKWQPKQVLFNEIGWYIRGHGIIQDFLQDLDKLAGFGGLHEMVVFFLGCKSCMRVVKVCGWDVTGSCHTLNNAEFGICPWAEKHKSMENGMRW